MSRLSIDDMQLHGVLECPACDQPVHVVASREDETARWCCLRCRTVGSAPFVAAEERDRPRRLPPPPTPARA